MPDLRIDDLTVEFSNGGFNIRPLDHFSLEIPSGSLALLLGPSGCGKTTLLSCLGSILTPTSGSITFGDVEIAGLKGAELTELPAQHHRHRVPGVQPGGESERPGERRTSDAGGRVRLEDLQRPGGRAARPVRARRTLHHRPGGLSGGQQQRVAVARALALDPPLILADEPTAHLDYIQVESLLQIIRELASGDRVVVVATHDQRLVPLADEVVELVPNLGASDLPPETVQLDAGEVLFRQGSWGDRIYVIEAGEIEILSEHADDRHELQGRRGRRKLFRRDGPALQSPPDGHGPGPDPCPAHRLHGPRFPEPARPRPPHHGR